MSKMLKKAKKAISDLFGDTSVSPEETLSYLEELRDEIDSLIDAIELDL